MFMICHDNIIIAGGAVDGRQNPSVVLHDDADVLVSGIEHQVAGLRIDPGSHIAIAVLVGRAASLPYNVFAAAGIIETPIDKTGAIHRMNAPCPWRGCRQP